MSEGIPDEIVRALNAVGFVLFAETIAGEFSFERYSPVRESELLLVRYDAHTWRIKVTARGKDQDWEPVPLPFLAPLDGGWAAILASRLVRDFLQQFLVPAIEGAPQA